MIATTVWTAPSITVNMGCCLLTDMGVRSATCRGAGAGGRGSGIGQGRRGGAWGSLMGLTGSCQAH